jgi:hypothetical protein
MADSFLGVSRDTWRFINTFAPWLSALGTLIAVAASLVIARRVHSNRLTVSVGARLLLESGRAANDNLFMTIIVTNTGPRPLTVTGAGWRVGMLRKKTFVINLFGGGQHPYSAKLPCVLDPGLQAQWLVEIRKDQDGWLNDTARNMLLPWWRSNIRTLRLQVWTSSGEVFEARPASSLIGVLSDACRTLTKRQLHG